MEHSSADARRPAGLRGSGERSTEMRGSNTDLSTTAGTGTPPAVAGMSPVPDEILVRQASLGDKTAFAHLVRRHGPALYRYVLRLLNDPSDAEDCVQEVLLAAWKGIVSFRGDSSIRSWLLVLARHQAQRLSQRQRPQFPKSGSRPVVDVDAAMAQLHDLRADPAGDTIDSALRIALDAALLILPERQRSVWILREVEDLSYAEIASVVGTSPTVVKGLLERARAAIAASLEDWR